MTATAPSTAARSRRRRFPGLRHNAGARFGLVAVWACVAVIFWILRPDTFATTANWQNILASQAVLLVLALGVSIPLRAGDFDLSIASAATLVGIVIAKLNVVEGLPLVPALLIGLLVGLLIGAINGFLVVGMAINSFIATLGTATVLSGLVDWISGSNVIVGVSPALSTSVIGDHFLGISLEFWYGLALCGVVWYVLQLTAVGQRLLFVGLNRSVAQLSGVRVDRARFMSLVVSGALAGVAGILIVGTQGAADPAAGSSYLLPAFAAAYLGSTAIIPGRFNAWGTFVAVYFLATGITGLQLLGLQSFVQDLFYGSALIVAVAVSQYARRARRGKVTRGQLTTDSPKEESTT